MTATLDNRSNFMKFLHYVMIIPRAGAFTALRRF